jgi:protease-4
LRNAVADLRRAGKRIFVYADVYDTSTYVVASAATNICMLPAGEMMMPGIGIETMFYRGTMDKVGITPDFIQIGEFKGAEEPYTRTKPSDELRGEMNKLVDAMFTHIVDGVADARGLSRDTIRRAIDDTMVSGEQAKDRGFVDHLLDQDGLRALMETELGGEVNLIDDYGEAARQEIDFTNIFALLKAMNARPEEPKGPSVALLYAEGVITDGAGEGSLLEAGGVGSERMREAFRVALKDENVKAVVVRIDSPGGSALASEVMWQAARRVAEKKPVVISIGGMAASGGYYLASAGDYIFADPAAIIGSIGVVGGKFVMKDLFEKVGLSTEAFTRGRNADLFSSSRTWDDRQRKLVRQSMQDVYDQFTQRIMTTRSGKIVDIDKVARGRIFLAAEAHKLGMVDELGGLEAAIAHAATKAGLDAKDVNVKLLPAPRTLADMLASGKPMMESRGPGVQVNVNVSTFDALLLQMPPQARRALTQQLQLMKLLEKRPVVLMAPYSITVR